MLKILHFVLIDFEWDMTGPINQLAYESTVAKSLAQEFLWETKCFTLSEEVSEYDFMMTFTPSKMRGLLGRIHNNIKLRRTAFRWLKEHQNQYDVVVMRYSYADPFLYWHSRWFKNVFTVHHSFEVEQIQLGGGIKRLLNSFLGNRTIANSLSNKFIALAVFIERHVGKRILARTKGIIGVTQEIAEYENARLKQKKPYYSFPNGIDVSSVELVADKRGGIPKLIFIASDVSLSWNGLDLLIDTLKASKEPFEFHVVGSCYHQFAEVCAGDERFVFHGSKTRRDYEKLLAKCDIGFGAFAHKRINEMKEACTLKVREYLASGLPVYSGHKDGALPENFPFYKKGDLEVKAILSYVKKCREFHRKEVRKQATSYIDKKYLMLDLVRWMTKVL